MSLMSENILASIKLLVDQLRIDVEAIHDDGTLFDESLDLGDKNLCHNVNILESEL